MQQLVVWILRVITNTFFRRIDVAGAENVPATGAVIFAGNHPNALMDGWLLTAKCGRWPLHFMANAKLWDYPILGKFMDASGAVPVYRREDHGDKTDNQSAFEKLYEVIESGNCMGVFPEGVSHVESQLTKLKTGTARIALAVAARGKTEVKIVPCGLNYIHRHRFRSQVLLEFGEPIIVDDTWAAEYRDDEQATVRKLTDELAAALGAVTLNAPDWNTLLYTQTIRRLYKPSSVALSPGQYIELNRRFVSRYLHFADDPEMVAFRTEVENYQAQLELLGLKDHQLRQPVSLGQLTRKLLFRSFMMLLLLPLAIPGALLHLPIGWIAATVGERFSYETDDIATLKVFATILLLPILYLAIAITIGVKFGFLWALISVLALTFSFFMSVRLLEAETTIVVSLLSLLRLARLGRDVDELRERRKALVEQIRQMVDRMADPDMPRMFTREDFASTAPDQ
ncbi:MAG: lysophospholipid acyltransferase family protein [Gammaproteobacteria bacterium]|nr:lysophospholipid acyltransferase family protein [Gammaproteobacteria bacterium]